jgi:uncharacterized Zn-binding protein involved in type VI secretion
LPKSAKNAIEKGLEAAAKSSIELELLMPEQCTISHQSKNPADSHGCKGCSHGVIGPAIEGSGNVNVNSLPALRKGDPGVHSACCGPNTWNTDVCSGTVKINGKGAVRKGDATIHCGGTGQMTEGSGNVITGG